MRGRRRPRAAYIILIATGSEQAAVTVAVRPLSLLLALLSLGGGFRNRGERGRGSPLVV
jgi:hypothetical protein